MINIKDFDPRLLKLDKKSFKNIGVYYIGHVTKKDDYKINSVNPLYLKINSVNPLYLLVHIIDGFIEEKQGSKYLNIASTDSNSEVLKNMKKFGVELKVVLKK